MKKFQMFIHRHYDTIKLTLIVIIFILTFMAVVGQIQKNNRDTIDRADAVAEVLEADKEIVKSIKAETEAQTKIINRQFRALCILIIDTSGEEGLAKLDADSRQQCERLAEDPEATQETAVEQQRNREQEARPEQSQNGQNDAGSSSNPTPNSRPIPQDNSQPPTEPEEPSGIRQVPLVDGLLNFLGL